MASDMIVIGTDSLLEIGERMFDRGEIGLVQLQEMRRRARAAPTEWKRTRVVKDD